MGSLQPLGIDFRLGFSQSQINKLSNLEKKFIKIEKIANRLKNMRLNLTLATNSVKKINDIQGSFKRVNEFINKINRGKQLNIRMNQPSLTRLLKTEKTLKNILTLTRKINSTSLRAGGAGGGVGGYGGGRATGRGGRRSVPAGGGLRGFGSNLGGLEFLSLAGAMGGRYGLAGAALGGLVGKPFGQLGQTIGTGLGAGAGIAVNLGVGAVGLQKNLLQSIATPAASYQKNLRVLGNISEGRLKGVELQRFGNEMLDLSVKQGAGTIDQYMQVLVNATGKGLSEGAARQFTQVSGKLAIKSGTSIDQSANALLPVLLGNIKLSEKAGLLTTNKRGDIQSFDQKLLEQEAQRLFALTAYGGLEIGDIQNTIGQLTTRGFSGNLSPLQMTALVEAVSTTMPNPQQAATAISQFAQKGGKIKNQKKLAKSLLADTRTKSLGTKFSEDLRTGELNTFDILKVIGQATKLTKTEGVNEKVAVREMIQEFFPEVRSAAGAEAIIANWERVAESLRISELTIDEFAEEIRGGALNFDVAMEGFTNLIEVQKIRFGNVLAPFATELLDSVIGNVEEGDWGAIVQTTKSAIDDQFRDNPKIRESLTNFADVLGKHLPAIEDFVKKGQILEVTNAFIDAMSTINTAIIGLANFISDTFGAEEALSPKEKAERKRSQDLALGYNEQLFGLKLQKDNAIAFGKTLADPNASPGDILVARRGMHNIKSEFFPKLPSDYQLKPRDVAGRIAELKRTIDETNDWVEQINAGKMLDITGNERQTMKAFEQFGEGNWGKAAINLAGGWGGQAIDTLGKGISGAWGGLTGDLVPANVKSRLFSNQEAKASNMAMLEAGAPAAEEFKQRIKESGMQFKDMIPKQLEIIINVKDERVEARVGNAGKGMVTKLMGAFNDYVNNNGAT